MSTGVRRLDELLQGGIPAGSVVLVQGPPFLGKEVLARLFLLGGMREGMPGISLLTGRSAGDVRDQLAGMAPDYAGFEAKGLSHFVDVYSRSVGAEEESPITEYVDGPMNLNGVSLALNQAQRKLLEQSSHHCLVIDSASTFIAYTNAQTTFRFLQVLTGRAKRAGATTLVMLEPGMHTDMDVQMVKHLADGLFEFRADGAKNLLRVEGLGVTESRGWAEYRFAEASMEITGSFAAGRIR